MANIVQTLEESQPVFLSELLESGIAQIVPHCIAGEDFWTLNRHRGGADSLF